MYKQYYIAIYRSKENYEQIYLKNGSELVAYQYLNHYFSRPIELGSHGCVFRLWKNWTGSSGLFGKNNVAYFVDNDVSMVDRMYTEMLYFLFGFLQ